MAGCAVSGRNFCARPAGEWTAKPIPPARALREQQKLNRNFAGRFEERAPHSEVSHRAVN